MFGDACVCVCSDCHAPPFHTGNKGWPAIQWQYTGGKKGRPSIEWHYTGGKQRLALYKMALHSILLVICFLELAR